MLTQISIKEAKNVLSNQQFRLKTIDMSILDSLGYVLGEDIISDINMPPFDRAALDGYAFKSEDITDANSKGTSVLEVIDFIPAGYISSKKIEKGQASRIMTGAKIPEGADAVIGYESTDFTEKEVKIYQYLKANSNIIKQGEDIKIGDKVLKKGHIIEPADIGILGILGREDVRVFSKPKVAIIATGNELINIGEIPKEGQIRNSNSYTIAAQVKRIGGEAIVMEICKDEMENISENLLFTLGWADMIITTGGVSVGDKDVVKDAFQTIGAEILFWKVNMRPGGPIAVAKYKDKLIFGLPGNPGAAYITFEIFARPTILRLMGRENTNLLKVNSTLESNFDKVRKQDRYLSAITYYKNGKFHTRLPYSHSSGAMSNLSGTNSLFLVPAGTGPYSAGDKIAIELLEHLEAIK